jgi:hypothetical protein
MVRTKSLLVLILAVAVAAVPSFMVGHAAAQQAEWKVGTAYLLGEPSSPGFSVRVDDWTYGAEGAVPHWIDRKGVTREGGWP